MNTTPDFTNIGVQRIAMVRRATIRFVLDQKTIVLTSPIFAAHEGQALIIEEVVHLPEHINQGPTGTWLVSDRNMNYLGQAQELRPSLSGDQIAEVCARLQNPESA